MTQPPAPPGGTQDEARSGTGRLGTGGGQAGASRYMERMRGEERGNEDIPKRCYIVL